MQGLNEPEGAEIEGRLRLAEVVGVDIAEQIGAALQDGELWGNYPQTYSLVGIINCAVLLSRSWQDAR